MTMSTADQARAEDGEQHARDLRSQDAQSSQSGTSTVARPDNQQLLAAAAGALLVGVLYVALPEDLSIGPKWSVLVIVAVLLAPSLVFGVLLRRPIPVRIARRLAQAQVIVLTLALLSSLMLLVHSLPAKHNQPARGLLLPAAILWSTNILVFTFWYWELDGGGPLGRVEQRRAADFQFVQGRDHEPPDWKPGIVDYLHLAFNTATAFSPTDTMPLTPLAKLLMMAESLIALVIIVLLVGRSVNIL